MKQNPETDQLKQQTENTEFTKSNNKSQVYRHKTAEELSELEVELESFINDNTKNIEGNLIEGEIVDIEFKKESKEITFIVEFKDSKGKFTIENLIEKDSKSGEVKSLENRVSAEVENTRKFFNHPFYMIRHKSGQLYGFIPTRKHKLTMTVFGGYCSSKNDKIFRGGTLIISIFPLIFALATGLIILGAGLSYALAFISSIICLSISYISLSILIGIHTDEHIENKSVYKIDKIE